MLGQLFPHLKNINYYSNRGVSGIDGSSSTAIGAATASSKETILITGDLSFIYDQNAMWNNDLPKNLKIFVINNQGGGIFNIIPGPKSTPHAKKHFETSHNLSLKQIAATFKINYKKVDTELEATTILKDIHNSDQIEIVEFFTGNSKNQYVIRILPPLTIQKNHIDIFINALKSELS